jgi:hypothetical protein
MGLTGWLVRLAVGLDREDRPARPVNAGPPKKLTSPQHGDDIADILRRYRVTMDDEPEVNTSDPATLKELLLVSQAFLVGTAHGQSSGKDQLRDDLAQAIQQEVCRALG